MSLKEFISKEGKEEIYSFIKKFKLVLRIMKKLQGMKFIMKL